jgi:hypothetical protein
MLAADFQSGASREYTFLDGFIIMAKGICSKHAKSMGLDLLECSSSRYQTRLALRWKRSMAGSREAVKMKMGNINIRRQGN